MLDANLKTQLEGYLKNIVHTVELVASLGAGPQVAGAEEPAGGDRLGLARQGRDGPRL